MTAKTYTTQPSTEYGIGAGVNGAGRRQKVRGWYVLDPYGKPGRTFTGADAETKAAAWAAHCNEKILPQYRW